MEEEHHVSPLPPAGAVLFDVIDDMLEGLQIISPEWKYVYVNDTVARHGKKRKEELLGRTMMECYPGIEHTEMFEQCRKAMDERISTHTENEFAFEDGSKGCFELLIHPVKTGGILILSVDITDRKCIEHELAEKMRALEVLMSSTVDRESKMEELKKELGAVRSMMER